MFGNTKRVAEVIGESMSEVKKMEVLVKEIKHVQPMEIINYDMILIGSPNHMGGPTRSIKKFIDKLGKLGIVGKNVAVFDTYVKKNVGKAVRKMEKRINQKVSGLIIIIAGLSVKVGGVRGPVEEEELPRCMTFGKKIANQIID